MGCFLMLISEMITELEAVKQGHGNLKVLRVQTKLGENFLVSPRTDIFTFTQHMLDEMSIYLEPHQEPKIGEKFLWL